jgi:hypothetical protein
VSFLDVDPTGDLVKARAAKIEKDLGGAFTGQFRAKSEQALPPSIRAIAHRFAVLELRFELMCDRYGNALKDAGDDMVRVGKLLEKAERVADSMMGDIDELVG